MDIIFNRSKDHAAFRMCLAPLEMLSYDPEGCLGCLRCHQKLRQIQCAFLKTFADAVKCRDQFLIDQLERIPVG